VFFSITAKGFLSFDNAIEITRLFSLWCIVGVGETLLLIGKEVDLSVGSHYAFLVVVLGFLAGTSSWDPWLASLVILILGSVIGLINGLIVTKVGIQSFVVTLGGFAALRGATVLISGGYPVVVRTTSPLFGVLTGGRMFNVVPWMCVWMVVCIVAGWAVLKYTKFGYHLYATGGNLEAARRMGVRTDRVKITAFIVTGALCALVAIITVGWLENAPFATAGGFELKVIAAAIIGGTSLSGGRGSVLGTLLGGAILGMLVNGLVRYGLGTEWEGLAAGAVILTVGTVGRYLWRGERG
jgi:ribose transport system permease protein